MFANQGIAVDAWARIEAGYPMRYQVVGDEAQIEFGTTTGTLSLVITENAVEALMALLAVDGRVQSCKE